MTRHISPVIKFILRILLLLFGSTTFVHAAVYNGTCGTNLSWSLDTSTGKLTISGSGAMTDWRWENDNYPGWKTYENSIKTVTVASGVTTIGRSAFFQCEKITSITLPSTVTSIGAYAFYECTLLKTITLPANLTTIGEWAFAGSGLTKITIPNKVTNLESCAFNDCLQLANITLGTGLQAIRMQTFAGCDALTTVDLRNCTSLISIQNNAFLGCDNLKTIYIPSNVSSIANCAFWQCPNITDIYAYWTSADDVPTWSNMTGPHDVFTAPATAITLHVPCEAKSAYGKSGWSSYTRVGNTLYTIKTKATTGGQARINGGTLDTNASAQVPCGSSATIEAVATDCRYVFKRWVYPDGTNWSTTNPRQITVSTSGDLYTAEFEIPQGTCGDNLTWILDLCSGTLTISGTGPMPTEWSYEYYVPWRNFRTQITSVVIQEGATTIGPNAFKGCSNLTQVTIPSSVTSIGTSAFMECSAIEKLYLSDLQAWYNVSFGSQHSSPLYQSAINAHMGKAYVNNQLVTQLVIPESRTSIGQYTFAGWTSVTSVSFSDKLNSIGTYAFYGCKGLTSLVLPNSVSSLGSSAFGLCTNLVSVTLPERIASISQYLFYKCEKLKNIILPETVTTISTYAFQGCSSLTKITIPKKVSSIGSKAFDGCTNLKAYHLKWTASITNPSTTMTDVDHSAIILYVPCGTTSLYQATTGWQGCNMLEENTTIVTSDPHGTATGSGVFACGATRTITATSTDACYEFDRWSDGNTDNPRTITTGTNTEYKAFFKRTCSADVEGTLSGVFTVSESDKIAFSKGLLQFNATSGTHQTNEGTTLNGTWRFADNQYDYVGDDTYGNVYQNDVKCNNGLMSGTYDGWIDLFAQGTSGYDGYQPYETSYPNEITPGSNTDWGVYNAISNGGNAPNLWRCLTDQERRYLTGTRPNAENLYSIATVCEVKGMIILPDNWILPDGLSFTPKGSSYTSNVYDAAQWTLIEASGAVFIPASGWMTPSASNVQMRGRIWTSDQGYSFGWQTNGSWLSSNNRSYRHAVRLVRDISTTVNVTFRGWKNGIENTVLQSAQVPFGTIPSSPTVTEAPMCKRFSGWDKGIVPATGDITYTAQYETVTYSVTVQTTDAGTGDVTIEKQ